MGGHYILKDGIPVKTELLEWAIWMRTADRIIAKTKVGETEVSTVFLGSALNFLPGGRPLIFETMVFGGEHDSETDRYSTLEEAMIGHERMVGLVEAIR